LFVVFVWYFWEKRRERRYAAEDQALQEAYEDMDGDIMTTMQLKSKSMATSTWDGRNRRKEDLGKDEENDFGAVKEPKTEVTAASNSLAVPSFQV